MNAPSADASPLLDLAALNDLKDMLGDALKDIADSFLEGLDAEVQAIDRSLSADAAAVRAAAHSLKGSAGNMGGRVLAGLAAAIEKAAMDGDLAQCQTLMPELRTAAGQTREALQAYMAQP